MGKPAPEEPAVQAPVVENPVLMPSRRPAPFRNTLNEAELAGAVLGRAELRVSCQGES